MGTSNTGAFIDYAPGVEPRVGELFMLGFRGTGVPEWLAAFEREFGLGGVILFDYDVELRKPGRNVDSPEQVRALCRALHTLSSRPLVFVDQEGGKVRRLRVEQGFKDLPSAAAFSALPEAERQRVAEESFREMVSLGVDFNLAPVIDVNTNPDNPNIGALGRSFSGVLSEVRKNALLLNRVALQVGLGLCLKHYPGLGGAGTDSHKELTDLTGTVSADQLALFADLCPIFSGSAILVSHGIVRDWDSEWPASISEAAISRLRASVGDALLITDDLQMSGLQLRCSTAEACLRGVRAGIDLLCIGNNLRAQEDECVEAARTLRDTLATDRALAERVLDAQNRVQSRKQRAA